MFVFVVVAIACVGVCFVMCALLLCCCVVLLSNVVVDVVVVAVVVLLLLRVGFGVVVGW